MATREGMEGPPKNQRGSKGALGNDKAGVLGVICSSFLSPLRVCLALQSLAQLSYSSRPVDSPPLVLERRSSVYVPPPKLAFHVGEEELKVPVRNLQSQVRPHTLLLKLLSCIYR